jgi:transketolase
MGWAKYSHEQFGLNSFGASGPYKEVYAKFGITGPSASVSSLLDAELTRIGADIATVSEKVIAFYKKAGHSITSPLNKALSD